MYLRCRDCGLFVPNLRMDRRGSRWGLLSRGRCIPLRTIGASTKRSSGHGIDFTARCSFRYPRYAGTTLFCRSQLVGFCRRRLSSGKSIGCRKYALNRRRDKFRGLTFPNVQPTNNPHTPSRVIPRSNSSDGSRCDPLICGFLPHFLSSPHCREKSLLIIHSAP